MGCEEIREKFSSLLEGDLSPLDEENIKEHLRACPECQKDFEQFKKTMSWLHSVGEAETPEGFLSEVYKKMEDRKRTGSRQGWVHPLMRFKLPIQAVAMVAIVFAVLYLTKMIPMETPSSKKVDKPVASYVPSEKKTGEGMATKGVEEKRSVEPQKAEPQGTPMAESKAPAPPAEEKKVDKMALPKESLTADAVPAQEIIVRTSDEEKTFSQLHTLVKQFGGEIVMEKGNILLASLPATALSEFRRGLEEISFPRKAEPAAPQKAAPRTLATSPREERAEEMGGKKKELERSADEQPGQVTVRIILLKE